MLLSQHKADLQEAAKRAENPQMLAELQKEQARVQSELDKTFADSRKLIQAFSTATRTAVLYTQNGPGM